MPQGRSQPCDLREVGSSVLSEFLCVDFAACLAPQACIVPGAMAACRRAALLLLGLLTSALASSPAPIITNCGDRMCYCHDVTATCFGNRTATSLPRLPAHVTWFNFSYFNISALTPEVLSDVLAHEDVQGLALTYFKLRRVDPAIFPRLANLTSLDLSGNFLPEGELGPVLGAVTRHTATSSLRLTKMNLTGVDFLQGARSSQLLYLDLERNHIVRVNFSLFSAFPSLQEVVLLNNGLVGVSLARHARLQGLNLGYNQLSEMPDFCPPSGPFFPHLYHLRLDKNSFRYVKGDNFRCMTELRLIDVSRNDVYSVFQDTFSGLPSLQTVYMAHITTASKIDAYVFNNSNLQQIIFNNNKIYRQDYIDPNVFAGCPNLTKLNFGDNDLDLLPASLLNALFAPLKSLKKLNLVRSQLRSLPTFLYDLRDLTHLYLSGNHLDSLNASVLARLVRLEELDVSDNGLTFVEENAIPLAMQRSLRTAALQGDSFACTCDILWLKDWIRRNTTRFIDYPDKYLCGSPVQGVLLADVVLTDQSCLLSHTSRLLVVGCSAILLLATVVFSLVYRYRWHLQYLVFMLRHDRNSKPADRTSYRFDAFVAYSADDHEWVVTQLMPALEEAQGLRLCLHERDFLAGNLVVDNIVDNIASSRRVLVVMSEGFARSEWCQFELNLAHRLTLERGQDLMVVVMLGEVARSSVTRVMYAVFKTITYISWPPDQRDREAFWTRLARALR